MTTLTLIAVQTDETLASEIQRSTDVEEPVNRRLSKGDHDDASMLTAADLADVLKWSQSISSAINLTSCEYMILAVGGSLTFTLALQKLTEIAVGKLNHTRNSPKLNPRFRTLTSSRCYLCHAN